MNVSNMQNRTPKLGEEVEMSRALRSAVTEKRCRHFKTHHQADHPSINDVFATPSSASTQAFMPAMRETKDKMRQTRSQVFELHQITRRVHLPGTTPTTATQEETGR
jgi:hypothetical protein